MNNNINPLLHRLIKEKKEDVVHTSAYAEAQNKSGIGSASVQSFTERRRIDLNRSSVGRYKDSEIVKDTSKKLLNTCGAYDANRDALGMAERRKAYAEKLSKMRPGGSDGASKGKGPEVRKKPGFYR